MPENEKPSNGVTPSPAAVDRATANRRFDRLRPALLGYLKGRFGGWKSAEADDAILLGLLAAWKQLCKEPDGETQTAFRCAYWGAFEHLIVAKRRQRRLVWLPDWDSENGGEQPEDGRAYLGHAPDFVPQLLDQLANQAVVQHVWRLATKRQRLFLFLRFHQGLELHEIADRQNCTVSNVQTVLAYALNRYRRQAGLSLRGACNEKLQQRRLAPQAKRLPNRGREACGRGHPFIGTNLRVTKAGQWRCRACEKAACQADRARRKQRRQKEQAG